MEFGKTSEEVVTLDYLPEFERAPLLNIRVQPDWDYVEEWAVVLVLREYSLEGKEAETDEIARIDNSHGQEPHIHRLFEEENSEEYLNLNTWEEAKDYLDNNKEQFIRKYIENRD